MAARPDTPEQSAGRRKMVAQARSVGFERFCALGADALQPQRSGLVFEGTLELAYRACLWSRTASRVLLELATFPMTEAIWDLIKCVISSTKDSIPASVPTSCILAANAGAVIAGCFVPSVKPAK